MAFSAYTCKRLVGHTFVIAIVIHAVIGQLKWTQKHDGESGAPPVRRDPGLGFNPDNKTLVLFGGMAGGTHLNDTWIYSITNGTWREINTAIRPAARRSFVYGTAKGRFYIATGEGTPLRNDIWQFDFSSETWEQLPQEACSTNAKIPQPLYGAAGGIHPDGDKVYVALGFGEVRYFETYAYDINKQCWSQVTSEDYSLYNPSYPHARCLHGGAMTGVDEMVIFGGCLRFGSVAGPCPIGDTWLLKKGTGKTMEWSEMEYCPTARIYTNMAKLPGTSRKAVLYGGVEKSARVIMTKEIPKNEVGIFDPIDQSWVLKTTQEPDSPPKRSSTSMATADTGVYMFGGASSEPNGLLNDLWLLEGDVDATPTTSECNRSFFNYIMVHGLLMFLGWGLFLQAGAFVARYLRGKGPTWFRLHVAFQIIGLSLSLAGFVFAILQTPSMLHFKLAHGVIGLIVMIGGCAQPLNAIFRPHPQKIKTTGRKVWELIHKNLGRIALLLSLVNITLGLFLGTVARPVWIVWLVYLAVLSVAYVIAEIRKFLVVDKE